MSAQETRSYKQMESEILAYQIRLDNVKIRMDRIRTRLDLIRSGVDSIENQIRGLIDRYDYLSKGEVLQALHNIVSGMKESPERTIRIQAVDVRDLIADEIQARKK